MTTTTQSDALQGKRITLVGRVQGLGVRPSVTRLARRLHLNGRIWNASDGVTMEVYGTRILIEQFEQQLSSTLPLNAQLIEARSRAISYQANQDFVIEREDSRSALTTEVPRDIGICRDCLAEIEDPTDRRFRYWLNSCASCGPRFSMISTMPYERSTTSMRAFPLCTACNDEYTSVDDRRFHAQGMSCPTCGPTLTVTNGEGKVVECGDPILYLAQQLNAGKIVAVKGIGGYQLLCDATNHKVVARLRVLKARPRKPLALLVLNHSAAICLADLTDLDLEILSAPSNPIVLARDNPNSPVSDVVARDSHLVGLMLPTTGVHYGLAKHTALPLVCTSANLEGEPLLSDAPQADDPAWRLADYWLHHNREIVMPLDDSVVRIIQDRPQTYRLARGLAPLPLPIKMRRSCLALGSDLKSTLAISSAEHASLGPHIGDLANVKNRQKFNDQVAHLKQIYHQNRVSFLTDLHPDFYGNTWVRDHGERAQHVQHHLAHIFSTLLDYPKFSGPFLGIAWDGYGFGRGGENWGGEAFYIQNIEEIQRVATIRPIPMPGGDTAAHQPWRLATGLLLDVFGPGKWVERLQKSWPEHPVLPLVDWMTRSKRSMEQTTSVGRLFDAVSSLLLKATESEYEGHAAIRLEGEASEIDGAVEPLPFNTMAGTPLELDWRPLIRELWEARCQNAAPALLALRFHQTLAEYVATIQRAFPDLPVVLSGGVFQNRILVERIKAELSGICPVFVPATIPANDGGLAAGQLAYAHELEAFRQAERRSYFQQTAHEE